jgi:2-methylcitrate dehydratase
MLARAGMTGPCQPFEAREGIISHIGPFTRDLKLPTSADGRMALETIMGNGRGYKRFASEGTTQALHGSIIPPMHAWAKPEEVESIQMDNNYYSWQEICDPPKWDPRNRETADHSMPYNIARAFVDGYIYLDSFTPDKVADPQMKELMNKITIRPTLSGPVSVKVRKKSGEERVFATGQGVPGPPAVMTEADLNDKFNRVCDYKKVKTAQRDQARKEWMDIRNVKDIGGPIATFAKFGEPKAL